MALNSAQLIGTGLLDGFRNRIINGDMRIDQRNNGAAVTIPTVAAWSFLDRWIAQEDTDGTATLGQSTVAPPGFTNSLLFTCTAADASLTTTQNALISTILEGLNISDFAWGTASARPVTVSFWVRSSLTGTFNLSIRNNGNDRSYVANYTISAANTWEYKTVTIPGDTTGTWLTTNGRGLLCSFTMGAGSSLQTTAGAWTAGGFIATSAGVNVMGTLNATFQLTGVQLEVGSVATEFERRSYGTELALCQRYYQLMHCFDRGTSATTTVQGRSRTFLTEMRTGPIITPIASSNGNVASTTYDVLSGFDQARMGLYYSITTSANANYTLSERISLSAEL